MVRENRPTEVDNETAIAFYENRGGETIIPEIRTGRPYRMLGRE